MGRLATCLADMAGWVELHASPGNPPTDHPLDPDPARWMHQLATQLPAARHHLETLATRANQGRAADHPVLIQSAEAG